MAATDLPTNGNLGTTTSAIAKITTVEMARSMVQKYAIELLGREEAQQFFMHLGFLFRTNPAIAACTPDSIFKAMMQCVNLGLLPNTPEQYCALIPYGKELTMQPMYPGGVELAYRSGVVRTIKADNVFAQDYFQWDDATNEIHHRKDLTIDRTDSNKIIASYAVAKLASGELMFEIMAPSEIKKIKEKSVKAKGVGTPWNEWEERMIRKTPLKRLIKLLPSSAKDNRFKLFARMDDLHEAGKVINIDMSTGSIVEGDAVANERATDEQKAAIVAANADNDKGGGYLDPPEGQENFGEKPAKPKAKATSDAIKAFNDELTDEDKAEIVAAEKKAASK